MISHLFSRYMIEKITTKPTPTVCEKRCINQLQKRTSCQLCQEMCQHTAIDLTKKPILQKDECENCGVCSAICPTGAFIQSLDIVQNQYHAVNKNREIVISCQVDDVEADLKVSCLAALPWEFYVYVALQQPLKIMLRKCDNCSNQSLANQVKSVMNQLRMFLGDSYEEKIQLITEEIVLPSQMYSRRELLKLLTEESKHYINEINPLKNHSNQNARIYRRMLINKLNQLDEVQIEAISFSWCGIEVNDVCYGCGVCETICPQKAISIISTECGERKFRHHYLKCTHCGLCQTVCLDQAIMKTFRQEFTKDGWAEQPISSTNCSVCQDPIPISEGDICIICKRKQENV